MDACASGEAQEIADARIGRFAVLTDRERLYVDVANHTTAWPIATPETMAKIIRPPHGSHAIAKLSKKTAMARKAKRHYGLLDAR
jgi:hypothetical protein